MFSLPELTSRHHAMGVGKEGSILQQESTVFSLQTAPKTEFHLHACCLMGPCHLPKLQQLSSIRTPPLLSRQVACWRLVVGWSDMFSGHVQ